MRPFRPLIALALIALPLAGCVDEEESTVDAGARGFSLAVEDFDTLRLDVVASGSADLRVLVEREDRSVVADETLDLGAAAANRSIEADVRDLNAAWVVVSVADGGAASVRVSAFGIASDGTATLLRQETYQMG